MSSISTADFLAMQARLEKPVLSTGNNSMPVDREGKLHEQILNHCKSQWPQWLAIHSRMDCETTTAPGVPDFVILKPCGKTLLIECKSKTGKLSSEQSAWHYQAQMLGHTVHVIRSMEEFLKL